MPRPSLGERIKARRDTLRETQAAQPARMTGPDDLQARIAALEARVTELEARQ